MATSVLWLRRDLRLSDHPALVASATDGAVVPLVVIDPALWDVAGPARREMFRRSVAALVGATGGSLVVRRGPPHEVVPELAAEVGAAAVHVSADAGPYGRARDTRVARELAAADVGLVRASGPYAVAPGTLRTRTGAPYAVFTPYFRAWSDLPPPPPVGRPRPRWRSGVGSEGLPRVPDLDPAVAANLPSGGERAARRRWRRFLVDGVCTYARDRDRPDLDGTSGISTALKLGELHPRTLLHDLRAHRCEGAYELRRQLAWRDFYADVLWHRPETARSALRPELADLATDPPGPLLDAWQRGLTGYPFVDAGMRQLAATGWMHNRVRLVTASFLVKDLHLDWRVGARHFLDRLRDGDLASNQHNWQWVAGTGTDAAPYFRVLNPVTQGRRFDRDGSYVRRWVPELAHLRGADAHEPWTAGGGYSRGYPPRVVEHASERAEALRRYHAVRSRQTG